MARPSRIPLVSGQQGWDAGVETNMVNIFDKPFPMPVTALTELTIEATYPAASYERCLIWLNHSINGWELWFSDGTTWAKFSQ